MKYDFQALIDEARTGERVIGTPAPLTRFVRRIVNKLSLSPLYPSVYETAHDDSYVSVEKLGDLGWEGGYSNQEALVDTYHRYFKKYEESDETTAKDYQVA